jgi:hypothetical protein
VFARDQKLLRIEEIENVREGITATGNIGGAASDRDDLRSTRHERVSHQLVRGESSCAESSRDVNSRPAIFSSDGLSDMALEYQN